MLNKLRMNKSQNILLVLYAFVLCAELLYFVAHLWGRPKLLVLLFAFFALGLVAVSLLLYFLKASSFKLETIFFFCLIAIGILYIVAIGPLKSNDETAHYVDAYWLSNLLLGIDSSSIQMRADDLGFYEKWADVTLKHTGQFSQLDDGFTFFAVDSSLVPYAETTSKNILNSPAQMYLFPSIGLSLGRLMGLGSVSAYYLGRLFALASFSAIAYVATRNTPIGKPVFMMVALLPMTLELSSSFSYDGPTIALAMLLISFCFKAIYAEKQTKSTLIVIAVSAILLVPLKVVYSFIVLLVLLIPARTFPTRTVANLYKGLLLFACVATFAITRLDTALSIVTSDTASYSVRSSYEAYSISDVLENPAWAAYVFLNTVFKRLDFIVLSYFGSYMGQVNLTPLCADSVSITFLILMLFAFISKDSAAKPPTKLSVLCIVCFILSALTIGFTMLVGNAERGVNVLTGVFGRYFIPVTPLLIPLFVNTRLSRSYPTPKFLLFGAFCLNVFYVIDIYGFIALA